jgi:hypothetical protein
MNELMEKIPKLRKQMKKFQEQFLFQVHLLKKVFKVKVQELWLKVQSLQHAKLVFRMNANVWNKRGCDIHEDKRRFVSLQKKACNSSNSPP